MLRSCAPLATRLIACNLISQESGGAEIEEIVDRKEESTDEFTPFRRIGHHHGVRRRILFRITCHRTSAGGKEPHTAIGYDLKSRTSAWRYPTVGVLQADLSSCIWLLRVEILIAPSDDKKLVWLYEGAIHRRQARC